MNFPTETVLEARRDEVQKELFRLKRRFASFERSRGAVVDSAAEADALKPWQGPPGT